MLEFLKNNKFRFASVSVLYILFIIWLGNYWFLLGLPVIFDIYISKKVNWSFWKKREGKNSAIIEWLDALIFAVIAVTLINIYIFQNYKIPTPSMESTMMVGDHLYVSKVAYGPRVPITPIAFPFAQNRMLGVESYSKLIQLDYKRLKGFNQVERDDIVVFNFPAGDTVAVRYSAQSYYSLIRQLAYPAYKRDLSTGMTQSYEAYKNAARKKIKAENEMVFRPIDRRDNYIKRCVAVPGDSLEIIRGQIYVNGKAQPAYKGIQHRYTVITNGNPLNPRALEEYDIPKSWLGIQNNPRYTMYLSDEMAQTLLKDIKEIVKVEKYINEGYDWLTFPYSEQYQWNIDNYGPIYIPKAGVSVRIDSSSLPFYERIIQAYEGNDLKVEGNDIYINGELSDTYTFKMDYYWMMGDNRHQSSDARIWGYVPENHIVGKPKFIWLSLNEHKSFPGNIRLRRMFNKIDPGE